MNEIQMIGRIEHNEENMSNINQENTTHQSMISKLIQPKSKLFWIYYSKILINFTWIILILSLLLTIGLTITFYFSMNIRPFNQTNFLVINGPSWKNIQRIEKLYGHDKNFRVHQQMELYPALDLIIKRKPSLNQENINETNMLNIQIIDEVHLLDKQIQSIEISNFNKTKQYNYSSLCAIVNRACMIDGNYLLSEKFRRDALHLPYMSNGIYVDSSSGANGIDSFIFGKNYQVINITSNDVDYDDEDEEDETEISSPILTEIISYVSVFRLRYALNVSNDQMRSMSIEWEKKVYQYLTEKYQSKYLNIYPSTSTAITDTINKYAHNEGPFMGIMFMIYFIFVCCFISIQGSSHTSVGYLSICGIISLSLSTGATFGLLSIFQIEIIEPMALIIFVIAIVDCLRISIVCGEYHRIIEEHLPNSSSNNNSSKKFNIENILPNILQSTCPYFISSISILILVYLIISFLSPMSCMKLLGLTLILYLIMNYFLHCTFFLSCLVVTLKRMKSRRHCLSCRILPNDYYMKNSRILNTKNLFEIKKKFLSYINLNIKKFFNGFLIILSLLFLCFTIWCLFLIDTRLFEEDFLPPNATSLRSYMKSQTDDYAIGPVIMFVIPDQINYFNSKYQTSIRRIIQQCLNETTINNFYLLWLDKENLKTILYGNDPIYYRITPYSQNDLIIIEKSNSTIIKASRFYCQYRSYIGDRNDLNVMKNIYRYAKESTIPSIFPFSIIFPHYESLSQIRFEGYLLIFLLVIITLILTLIIFFSLIRSILIILHLIILVCGNLTCLYLFHNLSFNFANALWLYIMPIIYIDTLIHTSYNINQSKWKYNRVILSLIISLIIFSFFPIHTYIFIVIRNSLFYQSMIILIVINVFLPSWNSIMNICSKKKNKTKQMTIHVDTENQNLVHEPNGNANNSIEDK